MSTASCAAPAFELAPYKSLENDVLTERIQRCGRRWARGC